jgi:GNAT superfamily N-acetyltransferase
MSAKGTPAWDVARIDRTFAETFVLRSELLVASCSDGIVGCCTLSAEDPEFWPDALKGEAAYLHKLAVRRTHAGRGVSSALIEACRHAARTQGVRQAAARLPPEPAWPIRAARIHPRRHFQSRLGSNLHRRTPRTRNLTSVRASRSMSGWDGPVASRSLAVRPRCLGCARGCRYPPLPSSTLDNAAAVIAADARAGLFGPVRLARPSACLGEISGGRINGGASPPFVRVKAEDSFSQKHPFMRDTKCGSVAKIVKLEHAWRRLDGRNDDGFQVAPFPG